MTGAAGPDIIICQKQNGYSLSHVSATEWDVAVQNVGKVVDAVLNEALVRSFPVSYTHLTLPTTPYV